MLDLLRSHQWQLDDRVVEDGESGLEVRTEFETTRDTVHVPLRVRTINNNQNRTHSFLPQ
jgi:hypothetical protein